MPDILDNFAKTLSATDSEKIADIREYASWLKDQHETAYDICGADDTDLRTFMLSHISSGTDRSVLERKASSLKYFFNWACEQGLVFESPFEGCDTIHFDIDKYQPDETEASAEERELIRLRALNHLAQNVNRSSSLEDTLNTALTSLVEVMGLRSAWMFLMKENVHSVSVATTDTSHDFMLAASCNLPPGLEKNQCEHLCAAPDCRCQGALRSGRLTQAVNVIKCSRLQKAASASGDTRGLRYHASTPIISNGRQLGLINVATREWKVFTEDNLALLSKASELVANAIERAELYDHAEYQRITMTNELEAARAVQTGFLPRKLPDIPGFSLAAEWNSALKIAGDFYDVFPLQDNRWGIVVADVSGKGTPSGLYSAMARTLIQEVSRRNAKTSETLKEVNRILCEQSSGNMFVTVFYAVLDPVARSITYSNAGHDWPFLRRANGDMERLASNSTIVGVFDDLSPVDDEIAIDEGDSLVIYTDGVVDALNAAGDFYDEKRLETSISSAAFPASADVLKQHLLANHQAFIKDAPQEDDITLVILSCEPKRD